MLTTEEIFAALSSSPGFIVVKNSELKILWCNSYAYGWTEKLVLGKRFLRWIHPDSRVHWNAILRRVIEVGEVVQDEVLILPPRGGPPIPFRFRVSRWSGGIVLWGWDVSAISPSLQERLTPSQKRILAVATKEPRTAKVLASLANLTYNSRLRSGLADMTNLGVLRHTPRGYCLP